MSRAANPKVRAAPTRITHHWVVIPRTVCFSSRLLLSVMKPSWPVTAPMVVSATGMAKVSANQALKPIQKKISHMPWLHESSQPAIGWSARLTKT